MGRGGAAKGFNGLMKYSLGMVVLVVTLFLLFKHPRYLSVWYAGWFVLGLCQRARQYFPKYVCARRRRRPHPRLA